MARALEYTLKYWLKSFTRDQFKLQGRTAQLSNLGDIPMPPPSKIRFGKSPISTLSLSIEFVEMKSGVPDINGDSLHASVGFPATLTVTTAKVRKLEITVTRIFWDLAKVFFFGVCDMLLIFY